jgi:hypothetical protein
MAKLAYTATVLVVGIWLLTYALPHLMPIITLLFVMAIIARVVWFYTRF